MRIAVGFVLAALISAAGVGAQDDAPTLSALEAAQLQVVRLTDDLRKAKLEAAACGGQLRAIFEDTYGADSTQRFDAWRRSFELAHPGWTYDVTANVVQQRKDPQ